MKMKKLLFIVCSLYFLIGCSKTDIENSLNMIESVGEVADAIITEAEEIKAGEKFRAEVLSITDGDTISIKFLEDLRTNPNLLKATNKEIKVRILSIDTPEKFGEKAKNGPQPFAEEASKRAKDLLLGKEVTVELSKNSNPYDKYGRLLANIWLDDVLYQKIMLEEGLARLAYVYDPDTQYINSILLPAQEKAKKERVGVWGIEGYVQDNGFQNIN